MIKLRSSSHKMDIVFVFALFAVFAVTTFIAVLIGVKQYQSTVRQMSYNYEIRTASSYLQEKIRQNDSTDKISIGTLPYDQRETLPTLSIRTEENGISYITHIYYCDNYLREICIKEGTSFSPSLGHPLVETKGFSPVLLNNGLLKITLTATDGLDYPIYLVLHSNSGKEEL